MYETQKLGCIIARTGPPNSEKYFSGFVVVVVVLNEKVVGYIS